MQKIQFSKDDKVIVVFGDKDNVFLTNGHWLVEKTVGTFELVVKVKKPELKAELFKKFYAKESFNYSSGCFGNMSMSMINAILETSQKRPDKAVRLEGLQYYGNYVYKTVTGNFIALKSDYIDMLNLSESNIFGLDGNSSVYFKDNNAVVMPVRVDFDKLLQGLNIKLDKPVAVAV